MNKKSIKERILASVVISDNGCWEWRKSTFPSGYAQMKVSKKNWRAHRLSYMLFVGKLKEKLCIDHVCKNKSCVNPEHLRQVSNYFNVIENSVSPVAMNAKKTSCSICSGPFDRIDKKGYRQCSGCQRLRLRGVAKRHREKVALLKKI